MTSTNVTEFDTTPSEAPAPSFADLGLSEEVLSAVADMGYTAPTPVQAASIPHALDGEDVLAAAQTGTGKTLGLSEEVLSAVADMGYTAPTPVQAASIPHALDGEDVLAAAQTGTGKTAPRRRFRPPRFRMPSMGRMFSPPLRRARVRRPPSSFPP